MKLGFYISELLREHDTVIIPGLGAFISTYRPAKLDEEGEKMLPPSKEISFTQQIRNNDGLLVGHVAMQEHLSHFNALHEIENERQNILYRLDKGEKVEVEKVGFLYHRDDGTIGFESAGNENLLLDSYGLGAISLHEPEEDLSPEESLVSDSNQEEQHVSEDAASGVSDDEEPEFEPVEHLEQRIAGSETGNEHSKFEPIEKPDTWPQQVQRNKFRNLMLLMLILIPLISAGIYIYLRQDRNAAETDEPAIEMEAPARPAAEPDQVATDTLQQDTSVAGAPVSAAEQADPAAGDIETDAYQYYLVGGSFKEEENVTEYMTELKEKGYQPFQMGKRGNFYLVGIGRYNSEREAVTAQREFLEQNPGSGAWVYEE